MNKTTKIILGSLLTIGIGVGVTLTISKIKKDKKEMKALLQTIEDQKDLSRQEKDELKKKLANSSAQEKEKLKEDLLTDIGNVKVGKFAYPKGATVNVRTTPMVNNGFVNNLIYKDYGKKVGLILQVVDSTEYGDKHKWYKVRLNEPFNGWTMQATEGYVREDNITLKNI